ncbi:MAG: orotidine-5'-phosphate decarboxylase [Epsilonproteobacteria bacterium]|nr:MAG: orotidine-5'-phosphate decarboxylase [Campylobacterota bacterium]
MKLCVALDLPTKDENIKLVQNSYGLDIWFKVGLRAYIRDGNDIIYDIKNIDKNFKIFLDLKLYDIPNTMATTALELCRLPIDMFNIHASSGYEAMSEVIRQTNDIKNRPKIIAVTALTSFDEVGFEQIYNDNIITKVNEFATLSHKAGLDGVVCSAFESIDIKRHTEQNFLTVSPGIRQFGEKSNDQKRVADIQKAKDSLVDMAVVGRPIYNSSNPYETTKKILGQL